MPAPYRDETEALLQKTRELEDKLAERDTEIESLKKRLSDQDAVFHRLEGVLEKQTKPPSRARHFAVGAGVVGVGVLLATFAMARASKPSPVLPPPTVAEAPPLTNVSEPRPIPPERNEKELLAVPVPSGDICKTPGVRFNIDGQDAFAPVNNDRDLAGHKYRRGGDRSPWFTVNSSLSTGALYVHGVGGFLKGDLGSTDISLLTIMRKGEDGGFELVKGGRSVLQVTRSDGKLIAGTFEADVAKVTDTTREPPFGTPVVRVRGSFCLPAYPANPSDTGP